jgi:hypothetical protein
VPAQHLRDEIVVIGRAAPPILQAVFGETALVCDIAMHVEVPSMFRVLAALVVMTVPAAADECVSLNATMQRAKAALTDLGLKAQWFVTTQANGDEELVIVVGGKQKPIIADFHAGCMVKMDGEIVSPNMPPLVGA